MYSELFETVPDALLVVDENGRIVLANRHTAKLFGYEPAAMIGQHVEILIPPALRARHHAHRAAYVHNPRQMPPYTAKVLSDAQLADLFAYIKSLPESPPAKDIPLLSRIISQK